jgi:hypothetical protein
VSFHTFIHSELYSIALFSIGYESFESGTNSIDRSIRLKAACKHGTKFGAQERRERNDVGLVRSRRSKNKGRYESVVRNEEERRR